MSERKVLSGNYFITRLMIPQFAHMIPRLRLSFVNVGPPSITPNGNPTNQNSIINTGKANVLAATFSDMFTVYSAKKFPGVVESTSLSKCFATQGIKIPIRKDGSANATAAARAGADDDE